MSVYVILRMAEAMNGPYSIPSSEASYMENADCIDVVYPAHGGRLQPDGTWLQPPALGNEFSQRLPGLASGAGQQYIPCTGFNRVDIEPVLDDPAKQVTAADGLVYLATEGRFDSLWDGVLFDISTLTVDYFEKFEGFLDLLSERVRGAGLPFHVAFHGTYEEVAPWSTLNYAQAAQVADAVVMYCYGWWMEPKSVGPYWWGERSIEYALSQGVSTSQLVFGIGMYSRYWPTAESQPWYEITYPQAMGLVNQYGGSQQWIDEDENGPVRERYADLGPGHVWISDADTVRARLDLAECHDLAGVMLFIPGMEDGNIWNVINQWQHIEPDENGVRFRDFPYGVVYMGTHSFLPATGHCGCNQVRHGVQVK